MRATAISGLWFSSRKALGFFLDVDVDDDDGDVDVDDEVI